VKNIIVVETFELKPNKLFPQNEHATPVPNRCYVPLSEALRNKVSLALDIIEQHGLTSLAIKDYSPKWVFGRNDSIYSVKSVDLNVSRYAIDFTGCFTFLDTPSFSTQLIPLDMVLGEVKCIEINSADLKPNLLIENLLHKHTILQSKFEEVSDLIDNVDEMAKAIEKAVLPEGSALSEKYQQLYDEALHIPEKLEVEYVKLEQELEALCWKICLSLFGIRKGDSFGYVSVEQSKKTITPVRIDIYDKKMTLWGPKIMKTGKLSKRQDTIYVSLEHLYEYT
jgi:hypothetical protein